MEPLKHEKSHHKSIVSPLLLHLHLHHSYNANDRGEQVKRYCRLQGF
jgi:hypothetical protein